MFTYLMYALTLIVGFALGCAWYRYTLVRDPAKLERFAATIKAKSDLAEAAVKAKIDDIRNRKT